MGQPAAKKDDTIEATDIHFELLSPAKIPTPIPHDFMGTIDDNLSDNVKIEGKEAATVDSTATNNPSHVFKVGEFAKQPTNQGKITMGSYSVKINGKAAARNGDTAETCNDPADLPVGTVRASGSVNIGD